MKGTRGAGAATGVGAEVCRGKGPARWARVRGSGPELAAALLLIAVGLGTAAAARGEKRSLQGHPRDAAGVPTSLPRPTPDQLVFQSMEVGALTLTAPPASRSRQEHHNLGCWHPRARAGARGRCGARSHEGSRARTIRNVQAHGRGVDRVARHLRGAHQPPASSYGYGYANNASQ